MAQLLTDGFLRFANETGIIQELWRYEAYGYWALVAVGALALLLGFRVYRGYCSAMLFMLTATVTCILLRDRVSWRAVDTCFSVIGVVLAFFSLFWHRLDACLFCALIGGCAGWVLFRSVWGIIPLALIGLILTLTFPVETLRVMTSILGCWILWDAAVWRGLGIPFIVTVPVVAVGYLSQRLVSRKQTLFKKVRPDRVTHWLEERERKKQHADGISQGN